MKISLLLVTSRAADVAELTEILSESQWGLTCVSRLKDAETEIKAAAAPIVLLDRDITACWQDTMKRLITLRRRACVILISNVSDQYLWDEVIQHGGFDCLARPFRKEQALSTLVFALAHSRTSWPTTAVEQH